MQLLFKCREGQHFMRGWFWVCSFYRQSSGISRGGQEVRISSVVKVISPVYRALYCTLWQSLILQCYLFWKYTLIPMRKE